MAPVARADQSPPADPFRFTSDAALMVWTVKPDQTEAIELVWSVIRARLVASTRPDLKALGESLRIFRAPMAPDVKGVTYFVVTDPASKTLSYSMTPFLLFESGLFERPEADELYKILEGAIVTINPIPLSLMR